MIPFPPPPPLEAGKVGKKSAASDWRKLGEDSPLFFFEPIVGKCSSFLNSSSWAKYTQTCRVNMELLYLSGKQWEEGKWWHLACFWWHKTGFWLDSYTKKVHDSKNIGEGGSQASLGKIIDKMIGFGRHRHCSFQMSLFCLLPTKLFWETHWWRSIFSFLLPSSGQPISGIFWILKED